MAGKEYLYGGSIYSLNPAYSTLSGGPIGYMGSVSQLGTSVDARTANQVKEVSEHLNTGIKVVEVGGIMPDVLDSIPREHFTELNRLAKLTGADLTFHGPMIDPTGITQQGWTKLNQEMAERQMFAAVERSHDLNPKGNVNVTFHATTTGFPGSELMLKPKEGGEPVSKQMIIIDPASGKVGSLQEEEKYFPTTPEHEIGKRVKFDPQEELKRLNNEAWSQKISNTTYYIDRAEDMLRHVEQQKKQFGALFDKYGEKDYEELKKNKNVEEEDKSLISNLPKDYQRGLNHSAALFKDAYRTVRDMYDDVYKNATPEEKEKLNEFAKSIAPDVNRIDEITKDPAQLRNFSDKIEKGISLMNREIKPKMFKEIKEFAVDKAAETFANVAFDAYKKFGETTPILSIENHPAYNSLLTTGEELKLVIEKARQNFVEQAVKSGELSESEAQKQAEKLIGATWDVGHINMLKKYGYTDEDLVKQTEKVAPYVKKVHLSDNFGYEHTELPMGMGNVPIKEMMAKLGEKGFEGPKIIEALNWWQHFSQGGKINPPFVPTMQAFGTPMYGGGAGGAGWNQVYGVPGSYFGGYGTMLPEQNFQMYGAGFSTLPTELGGQMATKDSRFSGTPMS